MLKSLTLSAPAQFEVIDPNKTLDLITSASLALNLSSNRPFFGSLNIRNEGGPEAVEVYAAHELPHDSISINGQPLDCYYIANVTCGPATAPLRRCFRPMSGTVTNISDSVSPWFGFAALPFLLVGGYFCKKKTQSITPKITPLRPEVEMTAL